MNRKEEIILATLELASKNGLGNVSMAQIAEKLGIQKPSLYNHFKSKEEIISAMYQYLRDKSKEQLSFADIDYSEFIKDKSLEQALRFVNSIHVKIFHNITPFHQLKVYLLVVVLVRLNTYHLHSAQTTYQCCVVIRP